MKYISIILCLGISLIISSCAKDHSNYDYADKEVISVTGMDKSYTKTSGIDSVVVNPVAASTNPNAQFEYLWGIYETNVQGYAPVLDTLARTKDLNFQVNQAAKGWVLVLRVTNTHTGYAQYFTADLNVVTAYTRGWYVQKDNGTQTDLDLFLTPTNSIPESKLENVYSLVNGSKLDGKARQLTFFSSYKSDIVTPGKFANTRTLFVTTDKEVVAIDINTLRVIRDLNNLFYTPPAVKAPGFVIIGAQAVYLNNNGQLHSIYSMSVNTGQFGVGKIKNELAESYKLSKYFLTGWISNPILFDEVSSSFISSSGSGSTLTAAGDASTTDMPANSNNKTLLYMGQRQTFSLLGYAVLKDKTDPGIKILSRVDGNNAAKLELKNDTLSTTDKIYNATRYTLFDGDETMIYFVLGNEVWSRNLTNNFEKLQFTAPAGEEITYIRHRKYSIRSDIDFAYNYFVIATKTGANYKVRMFNKASGNLNVTPEFTLEGTGEVADVFYMAPAVDEYTYNNSY